MHEVLVHAPWVLGGDWDGDSVLLQVRTHRAGVRHLEADARARPSCLDFPSRSQIAPNSGPHADKTLDHPISFFSPGLPGEAVRVPLLLDVPMQKLQDHVSEMWSDADLGGSF